MRRESWRIGGIALALAVLAGLLFFWLGDRSARHDGAPSLRTTPGSSSPESRNAPNVPDEPDARGTSLHEEPLREELRGSEPGTQASWRLVVRVESAAGKPLAGVEVRYLDFASVDPVSLREQLAEVDFDHQERVERFGLPFRTDARGLVVVPSPDGELVLSASHLGESALMRVEALTEGEVLLRLAPELPLDVRLVDARGVGVPDELVTLRTSLDGGPREARAWARTDSSGRARLVGDRGLLESWREAFTLLLFVEAEVLVGDPLIRSLELDAWPAEELVLALPETGTIELEILGPDGARWNGPFTSFLRLSANERGRHPDVSPGFPGREFEARQENGVVTFSRVGLGLELEVSVHVSGWKRAKIVFQGPRTPGEVVPLRLPLAESWPSLRGRLVDPAGRALPGEALTCAFSSARKRSEVHRRTDPEGRFEGLGDDILPDDPAWKLRFSIASDTHLGAQVELAAPIPAGPIDLGDIVMKPVPLLAAGTVVESSGRPVRGAALACEEFVGEAGRERWKELPGRSVTTLDGRFEFRDWTEPGRKRLVVRRSGFVSAAELEFTAPREDWTIVLQREGAIAGTVLGNDDRLMLDVRAHGELGFRAEAAWDEEGAFRIGGLPADTYELAIAPWGASDFAGIPGIVVREGETTELDPLRVEDLLHTLRFDVRDENGARVPEATLAWRREREGPFSAPSSARDPDGFAVLRTPTLPVAEVRFAAEGRLATTLADVRVGGLATLRRGPAVRLVLADGLPALKENWSLCARLSRDEHFEPPAVFDARGTATLRTSRVGRQFVALALTHPGRPGFRALDGISWWIEVEDSAEEQTFVSPPFTREFLDHIEAQERRE